MNGFCCWLLQCLLEYTMAAAMDCLVGAARERAFRKPPVGKHFKKTH